MIKEFGFGKRMGCDLTREKAVLCRESKTFPGSRDVHTNGSALRKPVPIRGWMKGELFLTFFGMLDLSNSNRTGSSYSYYLVHAHW